MDQVQAAKIVGAVLELRPHATIMQAIERVETGAVDAALGEATREEVINQWRGQEAICEEIQGEEEEEAD